MRKDDWKFYYGIFRFNLYFLFPYKWSFFWKFAKYIFCYWYMYPTNRWHSLSTDDKLFKFVQGMNLLWVIISVQYALKGTYWQKIFMMNMIFIIMQNYFEKYIVFSLRKNTFCNSAFLRTPNLLDFVWLIIIKYYWTILIY